MTLYLVDTSVSVPLIVESHVNHSQVKLALADIGEVWLAGHATVETYSVLTRLPGDSRLTESDALALIRSNFAGTKFPELSGFELLETLANLGIAGGATYDGLIALAALAHEGSLVSRDQRAANTYRAVGVQVRLV